MTAPNHAGKAYRGGMRSPNAAVTDMWTSKDRDGGRHFQIDG